MSARRRGDELERKAREVDVLNRRLARAAAEAAPGENMGERPNRLCACQQDLAARRCSTCSTEVRVPAAVTLPQRLWENLPVQVAALLRASQG